MTSLDPLLLAYRPARAALTLPEGAPVAAEGPGGGLAWAVEHHGVAPLAAWLADGARLVMEDGEVALELAREGASASLRVRWSGGPTYEELVPVDPAAGPLPGAPPPSPAPAPSHAARAAGRPVGVEALAWLDRPLWVDAQGGLWDGPPEGGGQGMVPAVAPGELGSAAFRAAHGVRAAYVSGAMAGGIASAELVGAMANGGLLGFFGAGGLPLAEVEAALVRVAELAGDRPYGFNLLHNPVEHGMEDATVDLYLRHGVRRVEASAYMRLNTAVLRYRLTGIHALPDGRVRCPNQLVAKVSRPEVAEPFMRPPPQKLVGKLVEAGVLTAEQARMAEGIPLAEDITGEADSGGHTDRRAMVVMLPTLLALRDRVLAEEGYAARGFDLRVGAAGGIGDPISLHAALSMGADYVLTGSINQSCVEAGTSAVAKALLAEARFTDTAMGAAPDMFEIGAQVQVLGRGSLWAQRANTLYDLYKRFGDLEALPDADRAKVEEKILRRPIDEVWEETRAFWAERDPKEIEKAEADPRRKMSLVFRWYLGLSSRWARAGVADRKRDFQIWCGPSMGRFNDWAAGSALERVEDRTVVGVADALLRGAAQLRRVAVAEALGVRVPGALRHPRPG